MTAETRPIKVFYSYSHKDKKLRAKLETCLSALKQEGVIQEWHDGYIQPDQEWEGLIYQQVAAADLVLLLISPDFIQSEFCHRHEIKQALEWHEAGRACVIPIILRPTDWETSPFSKLQCLPEGGRPVTAWHPQDKAFLDIAKGIRQVVVGWHTKPTPVTPSLVVPKPALRKAYLNLMVESWHTLPVDVLDPSTADPAARRLTLDQVYVSLDTTTRRPDKLKESKPRWEEDKLLSVVEALCHADRQRLVLLGQPGSGKSTFGRHSALTLAQSLRKKA